LVPFQASVELKPGEAEQRGRTRIVAVRALERLEDGRPLEVLQGAGGAGGGGAACGCGGGGFRAAGSDALALGSSMGGGWKHPAMRDATTLHRVLRGVRPRASPGFAFKSARRL
jgi:hypothetical protein